MARDGLFMLNDVECCVGVGPECIYYLVGSRGDKFQKRTPHVNFLHMLNVLQCRVDELQISIMIQDANFLHLFNVLSCCRGRKKHFKHDSRCQVGSYVEHSVLCGEGTKSIIMTSRMTRQVNLLPMLNVLCCRAEGGK